MHDLGKRAEDLGLSAKAVASEAGLHPNTVSAILKGEGDHLRSTFGKVIAVIENHERQRLAVLSARVLTHSQGQAA